MKEKTSLPSAAGRKAWQYVRDIVITAVITYLLLHVFFNIVIVEGPSMLPTIQDGSIIFVQCSFYHLSHGDIVVCKPENYGRRIVKRVIGMPGDVVDINFNTGDISINGTILHEPYIREMTHKDLGSQFPMTIEAGRLFLLGDNRNESLDSRSPIIGQVRTEDVIGKYLLTLKN